MKDYIADWLKESAQTLQSTTACVFEIKQFAEAVTTCLGRGHKVLAFGNGGSASQADHFAGELIGRFRREREPMPALALNTSTNLLTAIGNDYGFETIFARQTQTLANNGDVAIGITTSGSSPNILKGLAAAKEQGATTILLTSQRAPSVPASVNIAVLVPCDDTAHIQEAHLAILHVVCEAAEMAITEKGTNKE